MWDLRCTPKDRGEFKRNQEGRDRRPEIVLGQGAPSASWNRDAKRPVDEPRWDPAGEFKGQEAEETRVRRGRELGREAARPPHSPPGAQADGGSSLLCGRKP